MSATFPAPLRDDAPPGADAAGAPRDGAAVAPAARRLSELLHDGFHLVFLLRRGHAPSDAQALRERTRQFLDAFERDGARLGADADDVRLAKFAFCALADETALAAGPQLRATWERRPLQLDCFGEQLAGERFFEHLEALRLQGAARLDVLEVFHLCLLLGFQGRYRIEGEEKLDFLTAGLGDEIARLRGSRAAFAPHGDAPDRPAHALRGEVAPWAVAAAFALAAALGYAGLSTTLERRTAADLAPYVRVVAPAVPAPHVRITLP